LLLHVPTICLLSRRRYPAQDAYKAAVKAAGLPAEFDWHSLRHTWASWHVQNGTPLAVLMQLGGRASYAMVLRYAHLAPSHLAAYAENARVTSHKTGHTRQKLRRPKPAVLQNGGPCRDRTYDQRIKSPLPRKDNYFAVPVSYE